RHHHAGLPAAHDLQTARDTARYPALPAIRQREELRIAAANRQVPLRVECPRALDPYVRRHGLQIVGTNLGVGTRMHRQYRDLPAVVAQVLRERERACYSGAALDRRKMVGNEQQTPGGGQSPKSRSGRAEAGQPGESMEWPIRLSLF